MPKRATLSQPTRLLSGVGVRSGLEVSLRLLPASIGAGLALRRMDLGLELPLDLSHALDLPNCSAIGTGQADATLFIEHLLAALHMTGITDVVAQVCGPEVPLLDGSSLPWVDVIGEAGICASAEEVVPLTVTAPVRIQDGDRFVEALPAPMPSFAYELYYDHPLIGTQQAGFRPGVDDFATMLAPARTFALEHELRYMQEHGLLRAGGEDNCLVIYPDRFSAAPTLPDEFARHKILDLLGDLYLLGRPVIAAVRGHLTGHVHNRALLARLAACQSDT
jgi:UDP-3-O-[3-hydroxymyristoyl] N-acetylglucosamine deacetylase